MTARLPWIAFSGVLGFSAAVITTPSFAASSKSKLPGNCVHVEFQNAAEFSNLIAALSFGKNKKPHLKSAEKLFESQKEINALVCANSTGNKLTSFTTQLLHSKTGEVISASNLEINPNKPDIFYNYELNRPRFQTQITVLKPTSTQDDEEDDRPMVAQEKMEMTIKSSINRIIYRFALAQARPQLSLTFSAVKNKNDSIFHFEGAKGQSIHKIVFSSFQFRNGIPELGPYRIIYAN